MKKRLSTFVLMSSALVLAACGNANEGTEESQVSNEVAATTVTVGVENNARPLSFTNDQGELDGYEVELLKAADEKMADFDFVFEAVDAEAAQVGLDTGKYGMIGGGFFKNPEREAKYLFTEENTGVSVINIYTRADDDSIKSLDDLAGKKIHPVTPHGGIYNLLVAYNEEHPDNQLDIQLGESGDFAQRFTALDEGVSDAIVMPANFGVQDIIDTLELNVKAVDEPVQVNPTYFLLAQDETALKTSLDEALKELKDEGTLSEISTKWYEEDMFQYELTEQ